MIKNLKWRSIFLQEDQKKLDPLEAFKVYYQETYPFVRQILFWNLKDKSLVEDLVQETYLKAWKSFSQFKQESSFKTWIYKIAINTVKDFYRKQQWQSEVNENYQEQSASDSYAVLDLVEKSVLNIDLNLREFFILYYKFNYTFAEIAQLSEQNINTVKTKVYKAKEQFIDFYQKNGAEDGRSKNSKSS